MRDSTKFIVLIWLIEVLLFLISALSATRFLDFPVAQPDSLLYCQGARRIVEGAPFSFSYGEAVTTGTTSVLYPFVLALPYALGARGSALLAVGFFINALFLLVFFLAWKKTFEIWITDPFAQLVATMLVVFSGQAVFCALAQSDMGIWMALSALFAYGMVRNKRWVYGTVLLLSPWFRPEGVTCIVAFGFAIVLRRLLLHKHCRKDWVVLMLCILSVLGVFILNFLLTGECQFSSVANKGHFGSNSFWIAVPLIASDALKIVKELALGMAEALPRELHMFPFLGGAALMLGAVAYRWNRRSIVRMFPWLLIAGGTCLVVANSGWQNTNMDRYLVWLMPLVAMFEAVGIIQLKARFGEISCRIVAVCVLVFAVVATFVLACKYHSSCSYNERMRLFVAECEHTMPKNASVGSLSSSGIAYDLSDRKLKNLSGIYSPEFRHCRGVSRYEILKNNAASRFDYWIVDATMLPGVSTEDREMMLGEVVLSGPDSLELRRADWRAYDNSVGDSCVIPADMQLVAQVIVGDELSEKDAAYEVIDRYGRDGAAPILEIFNDGTNSVFEVSRIILGGTRMSVPLKAGKDVLLVLRTKRFISEKGNKYQFASSMRFNLELDGTVIGERNLPLRDNGFTDGMVVIPGGLLRNSRTRIGILGDHLSCRYRFYQQR